MASPPKPDRPILLIVAGPNGSGKSSAYQDTVAQFEGRTIWIVNPDLLTVRIRDAEHIDLLPANLAAVQRLETWILASIDVHKSIGVETVLSTDKYRKVVTKAQELGFEFWLIYVVLDSPDLNVARVQTRVLKGGHHVAEADVRRRYARSLGQLPWFLDKADFCILYDNSGAQPRRVGVKRGGDLTLDPSAPKVLIDAVIGGDQSSPA